MLKRKTKKTTMTAMVIIRLDSKNGEGRMEKRFDTCQPHHDPCPVFLHEPLHAIGEEAEQPARLPSGRLPPPAVVWGWWEGTAAAGDRG